jgi:hypothetical protein
MEPIYIIVIIIVIVAGLVAVAWFIRDRLTSFSASGSMKRGEIGVEGKTEIKAASPKESGTARRSPRTVVRGTKMSGKKNRMGVFGDADVRSTHIQGEQHQMRVSGEADVRNTRLEGEEQEFTVGEPDVPPSQPNPSSSQPQKPDQP